MGSRTFRFAAHHAGTDAQLGRFVGDVERVVQEEGAVFGEYPRYEPGTYTFLADYLPWAKVDGMEHRNSTVMTSPGSIANARAQLLGTVAHEFFHGWNVERIRPRELEPFNLDRPNASGDLWLAEGFTQYYEPLILARAGLARLGETARTLTELVDEITTSPGRLARSAEDTSLMAPFIDGPLPVDRTDWSTTVLSYYPFGGAIGLALDLTLRERSGGATTLDDFMRAMWRVHGKPGGAREGYVDRPYTMDDAQARLAEVSGDAAFARQFFTRFVHGREVADYTRLLAPAGFVVRNVEEGAAWWGDIPLEPRSGGAGVSVLIAPSWPAYASGLDQDDILLQIDGERVTSSAGVEAVLRRHRPGDRVEIVFARRAGDRRRAAVTLGANPHVEVVPIETAGGSLTAVQRAFRDRWLGSAAGKG
jgi:predicted metalloprotease with PDZ domain